MEERRKRLIRKVKSSVLNRACGVPKVRQESRYHRRRGGVAREEKKQASRELLVFQCSSEHPVVGLVTRLNYSLSKVIKFTFP